MAKLTEDEAMQIASDRLKNEVRTKLADTAYLLVNRLHDSVEVFASIGTSETKDFRNVCEGISWMADAISTIGRIVTIDADNLIGDYSSELEEMKRQIMEDDNAKKA